MADALGASCAVKKAALRNQIIAQRDNLPLATRVLLSQRICQQVAATAAFQQANTPLLFASFGSEVQTMDLLTTALEYGKKLILPRLNPDTRALELRAIAALKTDLRPGLWQIPEPLPKRCPQVQLAELDFILVPGVAFDRSLRRLGYGGGYYDQLLADRPASTHALAVCFALQIVPRVPAEKHDQKVPALITEHGWIEAS